MKIKDKIILAILAILVFGYFLYMIKSILTPFVVSFVAAYFLHPVPDFLVKRFKMSRFGAVLLITGVFLSMFFAFAVVVMPIVYTQLMQLVGALPRYFSIVASDIYPKIANSLNSVGIRVNGDLAEMLNSQRFSDSMIEFLKNFSFGILSSSVALVNVLSLIFIMPILIFYLLKDWDLLIANFNNHLPRQINVALKKLFSDIDLTLSGYVRGQIIVCLILSTLYSILLSFTGLKFGFLIGLLTGIFSFIPYVGAIAGVIFAVLFALFQWGFDLVAIAPVLIVFLFGQTLETNFLTPKLIGKRVGLHPVWIIFGLFVFGVLFGFVGVLLATPLTAAFGVIIKHLAAEYKKRFV
jgi:predicted PurR-regulated permease PerM